MKRIAAELGVSITTVSKVLNNHQDIGSATRARVLARVHELGYRPNAVARSLTLRRAHTIGVIIPDLMHSFFVEIVAGIEPAASARGYGLLLCNSGEDSEKERSHIQLLHGRQVDGIVVAPAPGARNGDLLRRLHAHGVALVMIDRDDYAGLPCHRILTDDERAGVLATRHLLAAGRRVIVHLGGPRSAHARRREKGWRRALGDAGITPQREWLVPAGLMEREGYDAMRRLLADGSRVEAVFAVNDPTAIGAMKAVWDAGLRVPDDIAVVGVGDITHGDLLKVPLTTITWSRAELGARAADLLLDPLDGTTGEVPPQRVIIPPHLVVRESCGGGLPAGAAGAPAPTAA